MLKPFLNSIKTHLLLKHYKLAAILYQLLFSSHTKTSRTLTDFIKYFYENNVLTVIININLTIHVQIL